MGSRLQKKALAAAQKGDQAGAQAAVKEFVKFAEIRELDTVPSGTQCADCARFR